VADLSLIQVIPYSTLFIVLLSFLVSLVTLATNRRLTNREQMKTWNQEIAAWRTDSLKATRSGDKKLMAKVQKQQKHIMQLQKKMMSQSMKTSFIWFIPMMLLWWFFLTPLYGNVGPIAYLPGLDREPWALSYFYWYFLCSIAFQALLSRALGMSMGGD